MIDNLIQGLEILKKYGAKTTWADHDVIGIEQEIDPSPEDKQKLDELGWFMSEEYSCWCKFT